MPTYNVFVHLDKNELEQIFLRYKSSVTFMKLHFKPSDPSDVSDTLRKGQIPHPTLKVITPDHRMLFERVWNYLSNGTKTIAQIKSYKFLRHFELFGFKKKVENFEIFEKMLRAGKVKTDSQRFFGDSQSMIVGLTEFSTPENCYRGNWWHSKPLQI